MKPMTWKKWTVGIIVTVIFSLLTAGAGLSQGMSWQAFTAVLCTALLTNLGAYLMKHPVEQVDDEGTFNTQHSTSNTQPPPGGIINRLLIGSLLVVTLGTPGCVPQSKIKPGADPVVVNAEQFRIEATKTLDSFIQFVDRNPGLGADVKAARELAATSGPVYIRQLREATKAYKASRSPGDAQALEQRLAALRQLLNSSANMQPNPRHE